MLPTDDCDDCHLRPQFVPASTILVSTLPLLLTWIATAFIARQRLFPALTSEPPAKLRDGLPTFYKSSGKTASGHLRDARQPTAQWLAELVFSTSIGLSAVLIELLLCEISDTLDPAVRGYALRITLPLLMVLGVIITPALEIHGLVDSLQKSSNELTSTRRSRSRLWYGLEAASFAAWLFAFWVIPRASVLRIASQETRDRDASSQHAFTDACLERVGIIGISLMASLAGFAAVSSVWQTFGVRHRLVSSSELARKEAGLSATQEMLVAKQSRLRAVQMKMSEDSAPSEQSGFMGRVVGSFRGNPHAQEVKTLQMEVAGLQTMAFTLTSTLSTLRSRHTEQQRSQSKAGKLINAANFIFAIYCTYRICATSLSSLRRWWQPNHSFATSDPINNLLALLTTHWDSDLDRAAWTRQISFLLSGIMLLASFSAVLQTFRLFARFAPSLVRYAQISLPLFISQVAGAYVISSALLLRSNLPEEVSSVISDALGAPLEGRFVESWFESWFLVSVGLTATGILVGRKVGGGSGDDWDDDDEGSYSKRS